MRASILCSNPSARREAASIGDEPGCLPAMADELEAALRLMSWRLEAALSAVTDPYCLFALYDDQLQAQL